MRRVTIASVWSEVAEVNVRSCASRQVSGVGDDVELAEFGEAAVEIEAVDGAVGDGVDRLVRPLPEID